MSPEERDARTIFCMQLSAKIRPRDLEEFFSSVGKVSALLYNDFERSIPELAHCQLPELAHCQLYLCMLQYVMLKLTLEINLGICLQDL